MTTYGALQPWVDMAVGIETAATPGAPDVVDASGQISITKIATYLTVRGGIVACRVAAGRALSGSCSMDASHPAFSLSFAAPDRDTAANLAVVCFAAALARAAPQPTFVIIGICFVFAGVVLITCPCFYCCRQCGNCGGKDPRPAGYSRGEKRAALIVMIIGLMLVVYADVPR